MEIFEAFDLTRSLRGTAALAGCSHNTVARLVRRTGRRRRQACAGRPDDGDRRVPPGGSETASSAATVNRRSGQPRRGDQLEAGQRGLSGATPYGTLLPHIICPSVSLRMGAGWTFRLWRVVRCPAWRNGWRW